MVATATHLVTRAAAYHLLALGYDYPRPAQRERLLAMLGLFEAAPAGLPPAALGAFRDHVRHADQGEVEADFNRLFSGALDCPPHETAYEPDIFRRQRALADLAGFYRAFGFDLETPSRWQPDHLGVELEFCAILLQRQAHALEQDWDEPADVCADALRAFLLDHPGRWYAAFSRRLERLTSTDVYRDLAVLTRGWVRQELDTLGLRPTPLADRPRSPEDAAPPACGACPVAPTTVP